MAQSYITDAARWKAVSTRDSAAANSFVYCVKTTKIYCRPNCPSRLARRANIEYFDTIAEAVAQGYRACQRCRPDLVLHEPQNDMVIKACEAIRAASRSGKNLSLDELANGVGLTKSHFHRVFKQVTGITPKAFRQQLDVKHDSVTQGDQNTYMQAVLDSGFPLTSLAIGCEALRGEVDMSFWIQDDMIDKDFIFHEDITT